MVLEGKVALVTGAGRGIGKAIALHLARGGADVAVADIDQDTAEQTSIDIRELGRNSIAIKVDLGDTDDMERMVSDAASTNTSFTTLEDPLMVSDPTPANMITFCPTLEVPLMVSDPP